MDSLARKIAYIPYVAWRQTRWLIGDKSPFAATLKLTTRCTLKCAHCPWLDRPIDDLPTERWKEIIGEVRSLGARHLVMEGGEPTLREDLSDLIAHARSLGMAVTVASNATRSLDQYLPDRFLISVDGLEDAHDLVRGKGAFARMVDNLPSARVSKIALVSLSRQNVHQLEQILEYFTARFDGFWFSFVYDYDGKDGLALSTEQKQEAARKLLSLMREYPIINKPSYLKRVGTKRDCKDWLLYTVTADGEIRPGCMIEAIGPCRCDECELACHREFSDFLDPRLYPYHLLDYLARLARR